MQYILTKDELDKMIRAENEKAYWEGWSDAERLTANIFGGVDVEPYRYGRVLPGSSSMAIPKDSFWYKFKGLVQAQFNSEPTKKNRKGKR